MLAMRGDAWTARFRAQTFTLFPRIRVYINKETRVAKFPALSRVIKFKHRAQGRGDGFCRGGWKEARGGRPASERESSAGKMRVHTGCPERIEFPGHVSTSNETRKQRYTSGGPSLLYCRSNARETAFVNSSNFIFISL